MKVTVIWPDGSTPAGPTLRDLFAAGAIAATYGASQYSHKPDEAARRAFEIADAMLAERERCK